MAPSPETSEGRTSTPLQMEQLLGPDRWISPHFRLSEFRDKRTGALRGPDPELVLVLERIRLLRGRPLVIVSGYRSPATNRAVGGARSSQHLYGRAVDIPIGYVSEAEAHAAGARGIGLSGEWATHVDVRKGQPAVWRY